MSQILVAIALMFVIASSNVGATERKQWEQLTECRYVAMKYNDGDSFRVNCGGREFVLRLYYIDAPEANLTNGARVVEQRAYFGVTIEDILATGESATKRVREILQEPFVVSTRWAGGAGRSAEPRYYGLVDVGGKRLIEVLLAEGLARTKGVVVNLPTGEKATMYLDRLRDIERQAKDQKRGAWAHSKE
jgi:endonuclease YncB( thermonuclease family)